MCAIATHVDDLAVVGEQAVINPIIDKLASKFKIGAQEELHHFLSLKITRDRKNRFVPLIRNITLLSSVIVFSRVYTPRSPLRLTLLSKTSNLVLNPKLRHPVLTPVWWELCCGRLSALDPMSLSLSTVFLSFFITHPRLIGMLLSTF